MGTDYKPAYRSANAGWHVFRLVKHGKNPIAKKKKDDAGWSYMPLDQKISLENVKAAEKAGQNLGVRPRKGQLFIDVDIKPKKDGSEAVGYASLYCLSEQIGLSLIDLPLYTETGEAYETDMGDGSRKKLRARHIYLDLPEGFNLPPGRFLKDFPDLEFIYWDEDHKDGPRANGYLVFAGSYVELPADGKRPAFKGSYDLQEDPLEYGIENLFMAPEKLSEVFGYIRTRPETSETSRKRSGASGDGPEDGGWGVAEPEEIADLLSKLKPEDFGTHTDWFPLMGGVHWASAGMAMEEFLDWSEGDPAFADGRAERVRKWESLSQKKEAYRTATFIKVLQAKGVVPKGFRFPEEIRREQEARANAMQLFEDSPTDAARALREKADAEALAMANRSEILKLGPKAMAAHVRNRHIKVQTSTSIEVWRREARHEPDRAGKQVTIYKWKPLSGTSFKGGPIVRELLPAKDDQKPRSFAEHFLYHDPEVVDFEGVVFQPNGGPVYGKLNLWEGFRYEPIEKPGGWSLFEDLIRNVICSGDEAASEYLLNWCAQMIQFPGNPAGSAIAMMGKPGTGKGSFASVWLDLFGTHGIQLSSMEALTGKFNGHLRDKVIVYGDESVCTGDKTETGRIKVMVTERKIPIEAKGEDIVDEQNCLHIILGTNEDWIVPVETNDRRFFVVNVSEHRMQDTEYFSALHKQLSDGGYEALLYDMLNRDISKFNPQVIPETEARRAQRQITLKPIQQWIKKLVEVGEFPGTFEDKDVYKSDPDWDEGPVFILGGKGDNTPRANLRADFEMFLANRRRKGEQWQKGNVVGVHEFSKLLKDLNIGIETDAKKYGRKGIMFPKRSEMAANVRREFKIDLDLAD